MVRISQEILKSWDILRISQDLDIPGLSSSASLAPAVLMPPRVPFWCICTGGYRPVEYTRNRNVWSEASDTSTDSGKPYRTRTGRLNPD